MRELLRDRDAMRELLKRRILRTSLAAVRKLDRIARGRGDINVHELRACAVLARLAPIVLMPQRPTDGDDEAGDPFDTPEWYTAEKIHDTEFLGPYDDEADGAWQWGNVFRHHGPQAGLFDTLEEARAYGRQRHRDWARNYPEEARAEAQENV